MFPNIFCSLKGDFLVTEKHLVAILQVIYKVFLVENLLSLDTQFSLSCKLGNYLKFLVFNFSYPQNILCYVLAH